MIPNKLIISLSLFIVLLFSSYATSQETITLVNDKQIDNRLIGVWKGSESDKQIADLKKEWVMERNFLQSIPNMVGSVNNNLRY